MNAISHPAATLAKDAETPAVAERLCIRVLAGRNQGAQHSLPPDRRIMLGHSYENDIVLRDADSRGFSLYLTPRGKLAMVEVMAGRIVVLGRDIVAGEKITLEPYVPVRMSGFVFAIGGNNEERWAEAQELARQHPQAISTAETTAPATNVAERIDLRTQPMRSRYGETLASPFVLFVAAALLLAVAFGALFGTSMLEARGPSPVAVKTGLSQKGFGSLSVERAEDGLGIAIVGLVADESELLRLKEWAGQEYPEATLGVATLDSAAEAADNLLAAHNVDAEVRADAALGLTIETEFLPRDRQAELEALLRRDLPRVRQFTFTPSAQRGESDLAYFFNAPGYGAASFVAGDPSYIVTQDGTRWFTGANLPTGHTIIEITDNTVTVERDGLRDTLTM
ncbi:MAG: hypothetical protein SXU28_07800 [Pseudomonadota bacterium]|nr:hypothetical protein [Pseudomonadota bacterium]